MRQLPLPCLLAAASLMACAQTPMGSPPSGGAVTAPERTRAQGASADMSFFVTSSGNGNGANFGGLEGADRHCQTLATAAGAGSKTWRAYLSTTATGGSAAVHARDRIGTGPWRNAKGTVIARDVEDLHGPGNNLNKQTALTEKGDVVSGSGDSPNMHDILTGSRPDGRAGDLTCSNWTSSSTEGAATVGHHDRKGLDESAAAKSWNSSHDTRGCSQDALKSTGGAGLLYCFAAK
jgi:hypothetical protein